MNIIYWQEETHKKKSKASLNNFQEYLNKNLEFKNTIKFDMVKHSIKK